mmetsp:Transcript_5529/g.15162  ORF Transcript_5529/g.15162 Transcript_5529/m.15162 type:complete len:296 (-) Transcript_5529:333-1220(-)
MQRFVHVGMLGLQLQELDEFDQGLEVTAMPETDAAQRVPTVLGESRDQAVALRAVDIFRIVIHEDYLLLRQAMQRGAALQVGEPFRRVRRHPPNRLGLAIEPPLRGDGHARPGLPPGRGVRSVHRLGAEPVDPPDGAEEAAQAREAQHVEHRDGAAHAPRQDGEDGRGRARAAARKLLEQLPEPRQPPRLAPEAVVDDPVGELPVGLVADDGPEPLVFGHPRLDRQRLIEIEDDDAGSAEALRVPVVTNEAAVGAGGPGRCKAVETEDGADEPDEVAGLAQVLAVARLLRVVRKV